MVIAVFSPDISRAVPAASAPAIKTERVYLYNHAGYRRPIHIATKQQESVRTHYAHVILRRPIPKYQADEIVRVGKLRKINAYPLAQNGIQYEQWTVNLLEQNINEVRSKLSNHFPKIFLNIEPYLPEDKLSQEIHRITSSDSSSEHRAVVQVVFFSDVLVDIREEIIRSSFNKERRLQLFDLYTVKATPSEILKIASLQEVRLIFKRDTIPAPTINSARQIIQLNRAQIINTSAPEPNPYWLNSLCAYSCEYYGRGVWAAIWDTGIDSIGSSSSFSDFRELDSAGVARLRDADTSLSWVGPGTHGTHVAGIVGGNGWNSSSSGGSQYLWRGIAPKVDFISGSIGNNTGFLGHVNNHSHAYYTWAPGYYDATDALNDEIINNHSTTHSMIYAAANNGIRAAYGTQRGYYSILVNSKNAIIVGSIHKDTVLRSGFSGMGPTRDGRIKPDIAAPGSSYGFPQKYPNRLKVDIDYIRFVRSNGTTAKSFEFSSGTEGWGDGYGTSNFSLSGSQLHFDSWNHYSDIENTTISGYTSNPNDSIIIRYRMRHPQIPVKVSKIVSGFGWNGTSGNMIRFNLPTPDTTSFQIFRARLRDLRNSPYPSGQSYGPQTWPTGDSIVISEMSLHIAQDTSTMVYSTNIKGASYPPYFYDHGTSMAAPVVSGITALMLEKWKTEVIPGANLHTQGPWNSTVKAILVHTATDLVKLAPDGSELGGGDAGEAQREVNPDLCSPAGGVYAAPCTRESVWASYVRYYKGPDYATGYGLVNAEKALDYTDDNYFLQDSIEHGGEYMYTFRVPQNNWGKLRLTLTWDDVAGNPAGPLQHPRLVNNLDLLVKSPAGVTYYPWVLNRLPQDTTSLPPTDGIDPIDSADVQPAYLGINSVDNVEVIDVDPSGSLQSGIWTVIVKGTYVPGGDMIQDFSLVSDYKLQKL